MDQGWTPEPELREPAPRRVEPVFDCPDLNRPNVVVFSFIGGACALAGLILFIAGLTHHRVLFDIQGLVLVGLATGLLVFMPAKVKSLEERARNLIQNGLPVMANVMTSDNMTGDSKYGRSVKYQVVMPGGELINRMVNADERRLPIKIPGKATALIDMTSHDVELYCALPFRAAVRPGTTPAASPGGYIPTGVTPTPARQDDVFAGIPLAAPEPAPAPRGGRMPTLGSIGGGSAQDAAPQAPSSNRRSGQSQNQGQQPAPRTMRPAPTPEQPSTEDKLPWE
jgi:hypothetical protein